MRRGHLHRCVAGAWKLVGAVLQDPATETHRVRRREVPARALGIAPPRPGDGRKSEDDPLRLKHRHKGG